MKYLAVTLEAHKKGTEQLFLTQPLLFSDMLLKGRLQQYLETETTALDLIFFDRGIPDVQSLSQLHQYGLSRGLY